MNFSRASAALLLVNALVSCAPKSIAIGAKNVEVEELYEHTEKYVGKYVCVAGVYSYGGLISKSDFSQGNVTSRGVVSTDTSSATAKRFFESMEIGSEVPRDTVIRMCGTIDPDSFCWPNKVGAGNKVCTPTLAIVWMNVRQVSVEK